MVIILLILDFKNALRCVSKMDSKYEILTFLNELGELDPEAACLTDSIAIYNRTLSVLIFYIMTKK